MTRILIGSPPPGAPPSDLEANLPELAPTDIDENLFQPGLTEPDVTLGDTITRTAIELAAVNPASDANTLAHVLGDKEAAGALMSNLRQAARVQAAGLYLATLGEVRKRVASQRMDTSDLVKLMAQVGKDAEVTPKDNIPQGSGFVLNVNLNPGNAAPPAAQVVEVDPLGIAGLPIAGTR